MAVYEYECSGCQKVHEITQKMTDAPITKCPECDGPVQRLVSLSSFALKGAGFYTNDYKRAGMKTSDAPSCPSAGASGACGSCPSAH